jgi:hypothetical protein
MIVFSPKFFFTPKCICEFIYVDNKQMCRQNKDERGYGFQKIHLPVYSRMLHLIAGSCYAISFRGEITIRKRFVVECCFFFVRHPHIYRLEGIFLRIKNYTIFFWFLVIFFSIKDALLLQEAITSSLCITLSYYGCWLKETLKKLTNGVNDPSFDYTLLGRMRLSPWRDHSPHWSTFFRVSFNQQP